MKILMVSMFSNHFFNWTAQLKEAGHEVYWIDVFDSDTYVEKIDFVEQIVGWRNRIDYPGRYMIKQKLPVFNKLINLVNQRKLEDIVEKTIRRVKPDIIQSFVLFSSAYPIINIMQRYPEIRWIYSAWGNDLYFMKDIPEELKKIKDCLPKFDYMFADCDRDADLGRKLGFRGTYLGTFPGGGGYEIEYWNKFAMDFSRRNIILIKGYQGMLGRANYVIQALKRVKAELNSYQIVFFGCSDELKEYAFESGIVSWPNVEIMDNIKHEEVMSLMGNAKLYIGNCISDGMPNTLLEAIVMGAFPIQSNPGGATAEIISHRRNGMLIEGPEDEIEIATHIKEAIENQEMLEKAVAYNNKNVRPKLERDLIKKEVVEKYAFVEKKLND